MEPRSEPKIELKIEKEIELPAPVSRVWRALTDYREFGEWFRVQLNSPFVAGQVTRGQITFPGYEHARFEALVQKLQPETLFSYTWHPYSVDPAVDYSKEPSTLVEFRLEKTAGERCCTSRNRDSTNFRATAAWKRSAGMTTDGPSS
jgi:uncharacterized protein YndB with AHSA1/START domain